MTVMCIENVISSVNKDIETLLWNWIAIVKAYSNSKAHLSDACYWYNERATVSTLAAAAWKEVGWCALEEYPTSKRNPERKGRCDLYFATTEKGYECEAKQAWHQFENSNFSELKFQIAAAKNAIEHLVPNPPFNRLALTFCIPSFVPKVNTKNIEDWLKDLQELPEVKENLISIAWVFPESCRKLQSKLDNRIYPGVALLVHITNYD